MYARITGMHGLVPGRILLINLAISVPHDSRTNQPGTPHQRHRGPSEYSFRRSRPRGVYHPSKRRDSCNSIEHSVNAIRKPLNILGPYVCNQIES